MLVYLCVVVGGCFWRVCSSSCVFWLGYVFIELCLRVDVFCRFVSSWKCVFVRCVFVELCVIARGGACLWRCVFVHESFLKGVCSWRVVLMAVWVRRGMCLWRSLFVQLGVSTGVYYWRVVFVDMCVH